MPRERLEGVVRTLNEKLPRRMRIAGLDDDPMGWTSSDDDVSDDNDDGEGDVDAAISRMSDGEMRRWVEELVGIRRVDPGNLTTLAALDLGTRTPVGMDVSPPTLASSQTPSPRTRNIVWPIEDMVSSDMDTDTDGNDEAIDGVGLGVDAGLHNTADDLSEDAAKLAPSNASTMCARTYSHPRGRGNLAMPLAALKEENEPEEERVGGEAVDNNVDEDGGRDEAGEAVHVAKRRRVLFSEDEHVSAASRRVPTAQGSRLLEDLDVSASPVFDWDGDDDDLRGRSSTKSAIGVSPNKQKRPANKLRRRRRSARVPERERVNSQPASVHSTTRPVSFPPCHFSICSSRSRSSSYEAPLPHSPSPTTVPIPTSTTDTTSDRSCKPGEPRILRSSSAHAESTSPSVVDPDHASSTTMARSLSERVPRPTDIDATLVPSQPQSPTPSRSSSRTRSSWSRFGRTRTRESEECSMTAGTPPSITDGPLSSGDVDVSSRTSLSSFVAVPAQSAGQCQSQDQVRAGNGRDDTRHGALSSPTSAPTTCASIAPSILTSPFSFLASTPRSRARSVSSSVVSRSCFENEKEHEHEHEHEKEQVRENERAASSRDSGLGNVDLGEGIVEGIWTALGKMEVDVAPSSVECQ